MVYCATLELDLNKVGFNLTFGVVYETSTQIYGYNFNFFLVLVNMIDPKLYRLYVNNLHILITVKFEGRVPTRIWLMNGPKRITYVFQIQMIEEYTDTSAINDN